MGENSSSEFGPWANSLEPNAVNIWREAMTQLRQLHSDVWNGVRFFLTLNGIIIAAFVAFIKEHLTQPTTWSWLPVVFLPTFGLLITLIAKQILKKHRDHYLNMLLTRIIHKKRQCIN